MPSWQSVERMARRQQTLGQPAFIGKDLDALRAAIRVNPGFFTGLPFFQRLLRASGFDTESDKAEQGADGGAMPFACSARSNVASIVSPPTARPDLICQSYGRHWRLKARATSSLRLPGKGRPRRS